MTLVLIAMTAFSVLAVVPRASDLASTRLGRFTIVMAVVVLPVGSVVQGMRYSLHESAKTSFCMTCHEMTAYGQSLYLDDSEVLAAVHFQNRFVDRQTACYTCHRDYAMFGDVTTKLNGMRHVYEHYIGGVPDEIKLYKPYSNNNCLSCHDNARSFLESSGHSSTEVTIAGLRAGRVSCISIGCHGVAHATEDLPDADLWQMPQEDNP